MSQPREHNLQAAEELILKHFDGSLDQLQEKKLAAILRNSSEARGLFRSYMRMEGRLHTLGRDGFLDIPPEDQASISILESSNAIGRSQKLYAATSSIAICAAVVLIFTTWILSSTAVNADSVLSRAMQAAKDATDRRYEITISKLDGRSAERARKLTMTLRGGGKFVLRPFDGRYVMGSDGVDYWLAFDTDTVWVTRDFRVLAPELQRNIPDRSLLELAAAPEEPLLLRMDSLLSLIEKRYDIQLVESEDEGSHRIRAVLRVNRKAGPDLIEITADAFSGVVQRVELNWESERRAVFELTDSPSLPSQWYRHSDQVSADSVERLY